MSTELNRITELENKIIELNRIIALLNEDKIIKKSETKIKGLSFEDIQLEALSTDGKLFNKVMISKHVDSDFINISFVSNEEKPLTIYMTEKSYVKFHEIVDVFKIKSVNTRQFEKN